MCIQEEIVDDEQTTALKLSLTVAQGASVHSQQRHRGENPYCGQLGYCRTGKREIERERESSQNSKGAEEQWPESDTKIDSARARQINTIHTVRGKARRSQGREYRSCLARFFFFKSYPGNIESLETVSGVVR